MGFSFINALPTLNLFDNLVINLIIKFANIKIVLNILINNIELFLNSKINFY